MSNLTSKIALVAGGAGEVGEGIVRQFLQEGTAVVVPSRSPAKLTHLAQQLGDLAAKLVLGKVLAAENSANQVRINNLVLGTPVRTRSRPEGQPGWISADDAGRYCVALAKGNTAGETIVFSNPDQIQTA